jgi:transcriptional regulator with XRE-family HTH domain
MARAALELGVRELALAAQVSTNTVTRFERGEMLKERTVAAIRVALEAAGVEFTNGGQPGVGLRRFRKGDLVRLSEQGERAGNSVGISKIGTVVDVGDALLESGEYAVKTQFGEERIEGLNRNFQFASALLSTG